MVDPDDCADTYEEASMTASAAEALRGATARFRSSSAPAPLSREMYEEPWTAARRAAAHKMETRGDAANPNEYNPAYITGLLEAAREKGRASVDILWVNAPLNTCGRPWPSTPRGDIEITMPTKDWDTLASCDKRLSRAQETLEYRSFSTEYGSPNALYVDAKGQTQVATVYRDIAAARAKDAEAVTELRYEKQQHSLDAAAAMRSRSLNFHESVAQRKGINAAGSHDAITDAREGDRRRGRDAAPSLAEMKTAKGSDDGGGSAASATAPVCQHWTLLGHCTAGDVCAFRHPAPVDDGDSESAAT
eukprot:gene8191-9174_t